MKVKCRKLEAEDLNHLTQLLKVYEEAFEMEDFSMPNDKYLQGLLEFETTFFYVAILENEVVGGLTAHILPSTHFPSSEVYIYDFAVNPKFQRKGIGKQLIEFLKEYSTNMGCKEIYVQADLEDQHAVAFYKATGGSEASVVHFSYELR